MGEKQLEQLLQLRTLAEQLTQRQLDYWKSFSNVDNWHFWAVILTVIIPLIVLFLFVDRSKMLLLGFFGLNYHIWFHYTNAFGISLGLWEYPYLLVPFLPSFALDASLVPICYMFLYQWTLNHNKNIYLYSILLSAFFAFIMKPVLVNLHFFHMFKGINYIHLFIFYYVFFIISKLVTYLFLRLQTTR